MSNFRVGVAAGVAALVTLGLLEVGLRVAGVKFEASLYEPDAVLYFVLRPNAEGWTAKEGENYVRVNGLGMRDRERKMEVSPGTVRVAFLGDSMVAAQQVPLEKTMTQILERRLSRAVVDAGRQVEVLNFAVGGYAPSQMYLSLDERVWAFHPDIVAVCLSELTVPNSYRKTKSLDDLPLFTLEDDRLVPDPANRPPAGSSAESKHWHQIFGDLHNRFRLLQLARTAQQANWRKAITWSRVPSARTAVAASNDFMHVWPYRPPHDPELTKAWAIAEAIFQHMIDAAREHGAEVWFVQIGNEIEEDPRDAERERFLKLNRLVDLGYTSKRYAAFAADHGAHYLYLAPEMREYSAKTGIPLRGFFNTRPYEGHWNEAGNAAAAQIIGNELLQRSRVFAQPEPEALAK
jgi:hypothetical protein